MINSHAHPVFLSPATGPCDRPIKRESVIVATPDPPASATPPTSSRAKGLPAASAPRCAYSAGERLLGSIEMLILVALVVAAVLFRSLIMLPVAALAGFLLVALAV